MRASQSTVFLVAETIDSIPSFWMLIYPAPLIVLGIVAQKIQQAHVFLCAAYPGGKVLPGIPVAGSSDPVNSVVSGLESY